MYVPLVAHPRLDLSVVVGALVVAALGILAFRRR